ncbi:hypothetical protein Hanom_Chr06g00537641 [Helianthus anomalus]
MKIGRSFLCFSNNPTIKVVVFCQNSTMIQPINTIYKNFSLNIPKRKLVSS